MEDDDEERIEVVPLSLVDESFFSLAGEKSGRRRGDLDPFLSGLEIPMLNKDPSCFFCLSSLSFSSPSAPLEDDENLKTDGGFSLLSPLSPKDSFIFPNEMKGGGGGA